MNFQDIFSRRIGTGFEVTCIAGQSFSGERIAVGTRDRVVMVWNVDSSNDVQTVFSIQLSFSMPAAIAIVGETMDIKVFGLFNGIVYVWHVFNSHLS